MRVYPQQRNHPQTPTRHPAGRGFLSSLLCTCGRAIFVPMEHVDRFFTILTEHWKTILALGAFFISGGYLIARSRTSGMMKMVRAHGDLLDDLSERLHKLRKELENARDELSNERSLLYHSEHRVRVLEEKVKELEARERELLLKIKIE